MLKCVKANFYLRGFELNKEYIERLIKALHDTLLYDPETGLFSYLKDGKCHKAGEVVGSQHVTGYLRIYLNRRLWQDAQLAYLYVTGIYHPFIGRLDKDYTNCKYINLYASEKKIITSRKSISIAKKDVINALDGCPLTVNALETKLLTQQKDVRISLNELLDGGYVAKKGKTYIITKSGHQEIMRGGEFKVVKKICSTSLSFQLALPGTLTAVLNYQGDKRAFISKLTL